MVINHMQANGVIRGNHIRTISESFWRAASAEEATEFATLDVLDISQH